MNQFNTESEESSENRGTDRCTICTYGCSALGAAHFPYHADKYPHGCDSGKRKTKINY